MPRGKELYRDLATVVVDEADLAKIGAGVQPEPPVKKQPKGSFLTALVKTADLAATPESLTEDIVSGRLCHCGPWVHSPRDRKPTYFHSNAANVRAAYGPRGPYAREHDGTHFEIKLGDTIPHESVNGTTQPKGVIYIRKVIPIKEVESSVKISSVRFSSVDNSGIQVTWDGQQHGHFKLFNHGQLHYENWCPARSVVEARLVAERLVEQYLDETLPKNVPAERKIGFVS